MQVAAQATTWNIHRHHGIQVPLTPGKQTRKNENDFLASSLSEQQPTAPEQPGHKSAKLRAFFVTPRSLEGALVARLFPRM